MKAKKTEYSRTSRLGELIQRELASLLQREVHAPEAGLLTISAVDVSPDLRQAKVYFTCYGGSWDTAQTLRWLQHASGELRHHLAQRMTTRTTPQLHFIVDTSIEYGSRLSALIDSVAPHDDKDQET